MIHAKVKQWQHASRQLAVHGLIPPALAPLQPEPPGTVYNATRPNRQAQKAIELSGWISI
jgi:hypothetical protein